MKDTEPRPAPEHKDRQDADSPGNESEPLNHQYDDIDREFYIEGAGDG